MNTYKMKLKLFLAVVFTLLLIGVSHGEKRIFNATVNFNDSKVYLNQSDLLFMCSTDTVVITQSDFTDNSIRWEVVEQISPFATIFSFTGNTLTIIGREVYANKPVNYGVNIFAYRAGPFFELSAVATPVINYRKSNYIDLGSDIFSCPGFSHTFNTTASPGTIYRWNTENTFTGVSFISRDVSVPGMYILSSFTPGSELEQPANGIGENCRYTDVVKFENFPQPQVLIRDTALRSGITYRCFGEPLSLTGAPTQPTKEPYLYQWSPLTNISPSLGNTNTVIVGDNDLQQQRIYSVTMTDGNGCKGESSITVIKNKQISVDITQSDATLCKFDVLQLSTTQSIDAVSTTTSAFTYSWLPTQGLSNPNISNPTVRPLEISGLVYTVTAVDAQLCKVRDQIKISKSSLALSLKNPSVDTVSICAGREVNSLEAGRQGGIAPFVFSWTPETLLTRTNDTLYKSKPINSNAKILVNVRDGAGCTDKDSVFVSVIPTAFPPFVGKDENICIGTAKEINATPSVSGVYSFAWSPNTNISSATAPAPTFTAGTSESTQNYIVSVTSIATGCTGTDTLTVFYRASTPVTIVPPSNEKIVFDTNYVYSATPDGLSTYNWLVSDTDISQLTQNATINYPRVGNYVVSLIGINTFGCSSFATLGVRVVPKINAILFVPTVFSPSAANDVNKTFKVFFNESEISNIKVSVFNVLGNKVYESSNVDEVRNRGWAADGYPIGVYTCVVEGQFTDDTRFKETKSVTLLK